MKFEKPLHVGTPNIGDRETFHQYIDDIFDRCWLTNHGPLEKKLEQRLCEYLGVKNCIATCNATVALEIAIKAMELSGEIIVPSFTFIATAHALEWQGITPIFCDIDRNNYNIDPAQIERHITEKTTGIIGVHLYGRPCQVEALQKVADQYGLKLLFDAAHALGCSHQGKMIGNFGKCEVFSFHGTKFFNSFEGGAVTTNDDHLADKIRLMRNFGFAGQDDVQSIGTNGKMSEVNAAMGLVNLDSLDQILHINRQNYELYRQKFAEIDGLTLLKFDHEEKCNWQYIVVEVEDKYPLQRNELLAKLREKNVLARRYFWPGCHKMEPYKTLQPNASNLLPVTEDISERIIVFPTGGTVNEEVIQRIIEIAK